MSHHVDGDVHTNPQSKVRSVGRITRIVRPLPGIRCVVVVPDKHHQAAVVILDAAPLRCVTVAKPAAGPPLMAPRQGDGLDTALIRREIGPLLELKEDTESGPRLEALLSSR